MRANLIVRASRWLTRLSLWLGATILSTEAAEAVRTNAPAPAITNISQFLNLTGEEAQKGYPVRWEGVVVYADPIKGEVLLKDATGALRVKANLKAQPVQAGQWVELVGATGTSLVRYPDFPTGRHYLASFEAPKNIDDSYVARVRGYLHPPQTGAYTFWIASDNRSELWLSLDADPAHAKKIAMVAMAGYYTASREWDKYSEQRSERISLAANQSYYIEALHNEDDGEDCLAVAWEGPGIARAVINGSFLSPWDRDQNREAAPSGHPLLTGTILREFWLNYSGYANVANNAFSPPRTDTLPSYFAWRTNTLPSRTGPPFVMVSQLRILSNRTLPEPRRLSLQQLLRKDEDFQWVETEGIIVNLAGDGAFWSILELADQERRLRLQVANPAQEKIQGLLNARLRVRGFCQGGFNNRGERVADLLWVPSLKQVSLLEPREDDWSRQPAIPLQQLTSTNSLVRAGQRVRVQGRAYTQNLGQSLTLRAGVSRFIALISPDGTNWSQVGEPVEIPINQSIYAGLAVSSRTVSNILCTALFDHVSGVSGSWTNRDIGNPPLTGSVSFDGQTYTLKGSGGQGRDTGEMVDQFHYLYQPMAGDGEVVARVVSVQLTDRYANAGVMMRETLRADSEAVYLSMAASDIGVVLRVRRGTGNPSENTPSQKTAPYWLKLARQSSERLLVRSGQSVPVSPDQFVEALGVLERTNQNWVLNQASYRVTSGESATPIPTPERPVQSPMTSVQQIRQFGAEELAQARPASIRGVITAKAGDLYVQDGTGGIRLPALWSQKFVACEVGQYVEVAGRCVTGDYSPVLEPNRVTVVGAGQMPEAQPKTWGQLMSGKEDAQWVEVRGVVRSVEGRNLKFQMPGGVVSAVLNFEFPKDHARQLVDATVRLQGICKVLANEKRQLVGIQLLIPTPEQVAVVELAPEDPFNQPSCHFSELLKFDSQKELFHRVKIEGVVTCQRGGMLFLQDATGGMTVQGTWKDRWRRGDRVEVVGFAESGGLSPVLTEALVRHVGTGELSPPARVPMDELLQGKHDAQRVRMEAVLLGQKTEGDNQVLEFLSERRSFRSQLGTNHGILAWVPPGSRAEIIGVFKADPGSRSQTGEVVSSFQVFLESPEDVVVLERPPWWTWKHTAVIVGILAIVLGSAFGWIRMLRRKVEARTLELKDEIEEHKHTEAKLEEKTELLEDEVEERKRLEVEKERIHKELLSVSRRAGMAEVATGVLHNVGNVLNSVNVSATLVAENVQRSKAASVAKVATLLNEHAADLGAFMTQDEKGQKLPGYLTLLAEGIAREQQEVQQELASLRGNIDHIKEIVAMQQNYARVSGVVETVPVRELVEDALKMHSGAYLRHAVRLEREYGDVPPITTDKHKVLQILVNVLHNAKYACDESRRADKQVTVRVAKSGEDRVKIEVVDNGIGILAENLTRIFQHGFSSRKGGHGFGLHSGALAAKELGGSLAVVSEGTGKGATFVLELPLNRGQAKLPQKNTRERP
jgi:signal transduction histidine kinase